MHDFGDAGVIVDGIKYAIYASKMIGLFGYSLYDWGRFLAYLAFAQLVFGKLGNILGWTDDHGGE